MRFVLGLIAIASLTGCQSLRFYGQAASGHWEILQRRERIDRLVEQPDTADTLKQRLLLSQEILGFAEREMGLPARNVYEDYVELARPYVVWTVQAAPEFSLRAKTWWYPIVGRLEYQGYFRESMARDYARRLEQDGYDVYVAGVDAYSTLGWSRDPVLSTFVFLPETELVELLIHELAHRRLFVPGDTDFNEAFATTVARVGVQRWLATRHQAAELADYLEEQRRDDVVVGLIEQARDRLERLYASGAASASGKAAILRQLREDYEAQKGDWPGYGGYDGWMADPINNAQLNALSVYARWVPAMEILLRGVGSELPAFYEVIEKLGDMSKADRHAALEWFRERVDQATGAR